MQRQKHAVTIMTCKQSVNASPVNQLSYFSPLKITTTDGLGLGFATAVCTCTQHLFSVDLRFSSL